MKKSSVTNKKQIDKTCIERICQVMNYMTVISLLSASVVRFTHWGDEVKEGEKPKDPFFYLLTIYLIPFAILIFAAELRWQRMLKYFEFLGYSHGKGLFFIFVALLLFDTQYPVDTGVSIGVTFVGIFNLVSICIVPNSRSQLKFFQKDKDSDSETDSQTSEDLDSENDADEYDKLIPQSYNETNMINAPALST